MTAKNIIKNWFKTGKIPTQSQFWEVFDSYFHKSEQIPIENIQEVIKILDLKLDNNFFLDHLSDGQAHSDLLANKVDKVVGKDLSSNDFTHDYKVMLDNLPVGKSVSHKLGSGIMANVSLSGNTIRGKVTVEITAIDNKILDKLAEVELIDIIFDKPFNASPFIVATPASAIYDYYIAVKPSGFQVLTKSYNSVNGELFGTKAFPLTVSFYYYIVR